MQNLAAFLISADRHCPDFTDEKSCALLYCFGTCLFLCTRHNIFKLFIVCFIIFSPDGFLSFRRFLCFNHEQVEVSTL